MVTDAFGPRAALYRESRGHSNPEALQRLVDLVAPKGDVVLLDIGTGPGHTAVAFAPFVRMAIATDFSIPMLQQVPIVMANKQVSNVVPVAADAHNIPFLDGVFDVVTCRLAAHHFADINKSVSEMARVCKTDGCVFVVDMCGSEDPGLFELNNLVERLRDPSHTFAYTATRWQDAYRTAGLTLTHLMVTSGRMRITQEWLDRTDTPVERRLEIDRILREALRTGPRNLGVGQEDDGTWFMANYQIQIIGVKS